jgi:hypothetical protein
MFPDEASNDIAKQQWEQFPWHEGITDTDGIARIEMSITAHDPSDDSRPGPRRDMKGRRFLIRSQSSDATEDVIEVPLVGSTVEDGARFRIEILNVGAPTYSK